MKAEDLMPGMVIRLSDNQDWGLFRNKLFKVIDVLEEDENDGPRIIDEALEDVNNNYLRGKRGETDFYNLNSSGFSVVVERKHNIPWL